MRAARLQNALERLTAAIRDVERELPVLKAEHDPLASHIFVSRSQNRCDGSGPDVLAQGRCWRGIGCAKLSELPADFVVVNDVSKRFGNIDHVVIGPTGVYVIDTKNWTGSVKADGQGELLWNGKPLPIKTLLGSVMDFQNKLKALTEAVLCPWPDAFSYRVCGSELRIDAANPLPAQRPAKRLLGEADIFAKTRSD